MPALPLHTEGFVLMKRPPSDAFQSLTVFSAEHGALLVLQRLSKKAVATAVALDLFDEVALDLESRNQGQTWFVREARLIQRLPGLGRDYATLARASALAQLLVRNPVPEEGRAAAADLLRTALGALAGGARPDLVWFKSLYRFARDQGYPLKEQWFPTLPSADRDAVTKLVNRPLAELDVAPAVVTRLTGRLGEYLHGHTEIVVE